MPALGILLGGLCIYYFGYDLPARMALDRKKQQDAEFAAQKKAEEAARPHKQVMAAIKDLKAHGAALPPCPLLFPLLDGKGNITALGSYLSYYAMKQASYLPQTVFRVPNVGGLYNDFGLFDPDSPRHKAYRQQLPLYFGSKDLGEGTILKSGNGARIRLRLRGTRPEKSYSKVFPKGKLHLAAAWMASCLQDYEGFRPDPRQAAYMEKPIFKNDGDLQQAARWETLVRNGGGIFVTRWEGILQKNPENPYLLDRWTTVLGAREGTGHLEIIESLAQKHPENTFYQIMYGSQLKGAKKYDAAVSLALREVKRDDDNLDWYNLGAYSLEEKGFWEEAIELLKAWTALHPENPEAWTTLAAHMRYWSWRGGEGDSNQRIQDGLAYAHRAAQMAPGDARTWTCLVTFATGSGVKPKREEVENYFRQAVRLDPYAQGPYDEFLRYLEPQWGGSEDEMLEFAKTNEKFRPGLMAHALEVGFRVNGDEDEETEETQKRFDQMRSRIKASIHLKDFERSFEAELGQFPGRTDEWKRFASWEDLAGKPGTVLDFARELARKDKALQALPPYLFLYYTQEASKNRVTEAAQKAFEEDPATVRGMMASYRQLVKLDPHNWHIWNRLASYTLKHHDLASADKAFQAIGSHWAPEVWSRAEFDQGYALSQKCPLCEGTGILSCGAPGCVHGTVPCPNHCLQPGEGEWIHMYRKGHPDTDLWRKFYNSDGSWVAFNQDRIGHVIKMVNGKWSDAGVCPVCHGKGRVECPVCHGKKICPLCHGTGEKPKKRKKKA